MAPEVYSSSSPSLVTEKKRIWRPLSPRENDLSTVPSGNVQHKDSCSSTSNTGLATNPSSLVYHDSLRYGTAANEETAESCASGLQARSFEWGFKHSKASTKLPTHHIRLYDTSPGATKTCQCSSGLPSLSLSSVSTRHAPSQDSARAHHSAVPAFLTDAQTFKKAVRALQGVPCAEADCEAPTSDLQQSPQAPHICLGASRAQKAFRTSDLMPRGPRPGGSCTDLRTRLHCHASNTGRFDEHGPDTFRLDLRRAKAQPHSPSTTLETPRPHMQTAKARPDHVSYLMTRHLADCDAMAATAATAQQCRPPCTPPQASPEPSAETYGPCNHPSPPKSGVVGCSDGINPACAERGDNDSMNMHAQHACSLSSDASGTRYSGQPPLNSDGCPRKLIHEELLTALAEKGVHVRYVNDDASPSGSRWKVALISTHDAHAQQAACNSNDSDTWNIAQVMPLVATGGARGTASCESASTTVEGTACTQAMYITAADADSGGPVPSDPADLPPSEGCLEADTGRACSVPQGRSKRSSTPTSACGYKHKQCMNAMHAKQKSDTLPRDEILAAAEDHEEGSDESVLHHLTLARRALDEYMFDDGDDHQKAALGTSPSHGQGPHQNAPQDTVHAEHAYVASPTTQHASLPPEPSDDVQVPDEMHGEHAIQSMCSTQESPEQQQQQSHAPPVATNSSASSMSQRTGFSACKVSASCSLDAVIESNTTAGASSNGCPKEGTPACLPRASAADLAAAAAVMLRAAEQKQRSTQHIVPWGALKSQPLSRAADRCAATKLWVSVQENVPGIHPPITNSPEAPAQPFQEDCAQNDKPASGQPAAPDPRPVTVTFSLREEHMCFDHVSVQLRVQEKGSCCDPQSCIVSDASWVPVSCAAHEASDTCAQKEQCFDRSDTLSRGERRQQEQQHMLCYSNSLSPESPPPPTCQAPEENHEQKEATLLVSRENCSDGMVDMPDGSIPIVGQAPNTECKERDADAAGRHPVSPASSVPGDVATVHPEEETSVVTALCHSLRTMMHELKAETVHRMQLQAEIRTLQAAQQRQNAALAKLAKLLAPI